MAELLKNGELKKTPFFVVKKEENGLDHNRYAVVISKKLEKKAVRRNRKRRQIYEIVRVLEQKERVPSDPSYDRILLARSRVMKASFDELNQVLTDLLTQN